MINPKITKLLDAERQLFSLTGGADRQQFENEFKVIMATPLISACEHTLTEYYPNDTRRLGYLLSACLLLGIRIGRKLDAADPILIESEQEAKP